MPWADRLHIQTLRMRYDAAAAAHRACSATLAKALGAGEIPSRDIKAAEARARERLIHALDQLSAAINNEVAVHVGRCQTGMRLIAPARVT